MSYHNVTPKKINKEKFLKCIELFCEGRVNSMTCAAALGISYPTFVKRANVFLSGEPMPKEWFLEDEDTEEEELAKWKVGRKVAHYDNTARRKKSIESQRAKRAFEKAAKRRRPKN